MTTPPPAPGSNAGPRVYRAGTLTYTFGALVVLFAFMMLGDFAYAVRERCVGDLFQVLLRKYQVSDFLFATLSAALPALMTVLLVPAIGIYSDNFRGRLGRRIPFLIATTPVVVAGVLGLAVAPAAGQLLAPMFGGAEEGARTAALVVLGLCWTLFEAGALIANSLFTALVKDVVPDEVIGRFYGMFRIFSLLAGILFNLFLFKYAADWYAIMFIGIAVIYAVGFGVMCWKVREGTYPPPPRSDAVGVAAKVGEYARTCLGSRFYVLLFTVYGLGMVVAMPINALSLKAAKAFELDDAGYGNARAITYTFSLLLAFPLGWLTDLWHPMRTALVATILYGLSMFAGWLIIDGPRSFQVFFIIHGVLSGVFFTTVLSLLPRLLPGGWFSQMNAVALVANMVFQMVVSMAVGHVVDLLGHDYRQTFLMAAVLALLTTVLWFVLFRRFNAYGGLKGY
jgi:MFS family permease